MRSIDLKVFRDLLHLRGQVLAISMVIGCGVAVLVMSLSTQAALMESADAYYERYALADVFAGVTRAPQHLVQRIAAIPGVKTVQDRVVRFATLKVEGFSEPIIGKFVSVPEEGEPILNRLVMRSGRSVAAERSNEVVLNETFAEAHRLGVGDELAATLNGRWRSLRVVGIALSPEYIYSLGPGALVPDDRRFGVLWMGRESLAAAFDLEGAFNDVALSLLRNTDAHDVIPQLDQLLERYGGVGAYARKDQLSNWFLMSEIEQQGTMSKLLPGIFLAVSAFLTNMVLARLIRTERGNIGLMKAFGYTQHEVGLHYTKMVLLIALIGITLGLVVGGWVGRLYTEMYAESFRFPLLLYRPSPRAFLIASAATLGAALAGAIGSVRQAATLAPAQAMLPPSPPVYRRNSLFDTPFGRWLDQPSRIILRNIARSPVRALMTVVGIAFSVGLLVLAMQWRDALDYLAESYFFEAQHQDLVIGLSEPQALNILHEFEHMPGVMAVEPSRFVSADLYHGPVSHRGALTGVASGARLQPIYDDRARASIEVPQQGLVLATRLASKLGVETGDRVWVHLLEGRRPRVELQVVRLVETYIGMPAYVDIRAIDRLLSERSKVQFVNVLADSELWPELFRELEALPQVSAVMLRQASIDSFYETVVGNLMVSIIIFSVFACALGFGVAYNAIRIALSERGRELATLRVLGFTRHEVSYILLGEIGLLVLVALPVGCLVGRGLAGLMANAFDTELYRVPLEIEPSTFGAAVLVTISATLVSGALVHRRLMRMSLVEVLKTRE